MEIYLIIFLILILIVVATLFWCFKIFQLFRKNKKRKAFLNLFLLLILVIILTWELRILPISLSNDFKNRTENLTGKKFWSWNEYRFEDISVRGEGYTFEIYKLNPKINEYFKNPNKTFFENYPIDEFKSTKWKKTPIKNDELKALEFLTPLYGNWSAKTQKEIKSKQEIVREIATQTGSYYSIENHKEMDKTIYLISPKKKLIIWINHDM